MRRAATENAARRRRLDAEQLQRQTAMYEHIRVIREQLKVREEQTALIQESRRQREQLKKNAAYAENVRSHSMKGDNQVL